MPRARPIGKLYHLVGDVLRSPDLAHHSQHDLLSGLRAQLAQEPPLQALSESVAETETAAESVSAPRVAVAPGVLEQVQAPALASAQQRDPAANASVFRWKSAAGFASIAAVAAVGWQVLMVQAPTAIAPQLAQTAAPMWWPWRPRMAKRSCCAIPIWMPCSHCTSNTAPAPACKCRRSFAQCRLGAYFGPAHCSLKERSNFSFLLGLRAPVVIEAVLWSLVKKIKQRSICRRSAFPKATSPATCTWARPGCKA